MAVLAIDNKELTIAEEACAAIDRYDKVEYIQYIKVPSDCYSKIQQNLSKMLSIFFSRF